MAESWDDLIGRHLLVGMTYVDNNEDVIEQRQMHGIVITANEEDGVLLRLANSDEERWLPPHLESYKTADEGEYRLRSTGEVVVDPDYLCTWVVRPGPGR